MDDEPLADSISPGDFDLIKLTNIYLAQTTPMLQFGLSGIPMVGADICGFVGNTTSALCNRWMQLGAFYPFCRNHNTNNALDQDPVAMGPMVLSSSIKALNLRYALLPYLYSLFVKAHLHGYPVARAMFMTFPRDRVSYTVNDRQFMWGEGLLIAPVLFEGDTTVDVYLPTGRWYDIYTQDLVQDSSTSRFLRLDAPLDTIRVLVRGGTILPTQKPGLTTTETRKSAFTLSVYLDALGRAQGEMFVDEGERLDTFDVMAYAHVTFGFAADELVVGHTGTDDLNLALDKVVVVGVRSEPTAVTVANRSLNFHFRPAQKTVEILGLRSQGIDLGQSFALRLHFA